MKNLLLVALAPLFVLVLVSASEARDCVIEDASDTSLNVRDSPNGTVINQLRNGRSVTIGAIQNDPRGRPWGHASGQYQGQHRNWGWVFMQSVNCSGTSTRSTSNSSGKECIIADPNDSSLNVRDRPNGKVVNRLRNGRKISVVRTKNDSRGRPWGYAVGKYQGRNRNWGWVFMQLVECGGGQSKRVAGGDEMDRRIKDFWRAEKILRDRGFSNAARISVLQSVVFDQFSATEVAYKGRGQQWFKITERLLKEYKQRYGAEAGVVVYTEYSPDTGRRIQRKSFADMAKNVSRCFKRNRPWSDCKLNYHPVDGCFLTRSQRKECARVGKLWQSYETNGNEAVFQGATSEICWNYPKGPGIQLPFQAANKSQIKLAKAQVKKRKSASKKVKKPVINPLGRPVCKSAIANGPACLSSGEGC